MRVGLALQTVKAGNDFFGRNVFVAVQAAYVYFKLLLLVIAAVFVHPKQLGVLPAVGNGVQANVFNGGLVGYSIGFLACFFAARNVQALYGLQAFIVLERVNRFVATNG